MSPSPDPRQLPDVLAALRRRPDVEAPELVAVDGADRLLLDELAALLGSPGATDAALLGSPGATDAGLRAVRREALRDGGLAVLDDAYGALTLGAAALVGAARVRTWQDSVVAERALDANARDLGLTDVVARAGGDAPVPAATLAGARVVLLRLPRSLDALAELAQAVARHAADDVVVLAGGMVKHMTHAMNDVLGGCFADVRASRGRHKARVLVARGPRPDVASSFPVAADVPDAGLTVWAHGAAFAGPRLDRGTRALLDALAWLPAGPPAAAAEPGRAALVRAGGAPVVLDLGCGTGVLATRAALALPGAQVLATDQSWAAVASARRTADAAGAGDRVTTLRDDAASTVPDASVDLVLCNPPFHVGAAVHTGAASKLFRAAARVLRPGGELWTVWNSHLRYRGELTRVVGPTVQVARDRTFTVTRTTRR